MEMVHFARPYEVIQFIDGKVSAAIYNAGVVEYKRVWEFLSG